MLHQPRRLGKQTDGGIVVPGNAGTIVLNLDGIEAMILEANVLSHVTIHSVHDNAVIRELTD